MHGLPESDNIYYIVLGISLAMIPLFYLYKNHMYNISITKDLNNISDLYEYSCDHLQDFFSLTSSNQLAINFLNNKFLLPFKFLNHLCDGEL